jgi:hypothetical protein
MGKGGRCVGLTTLPPVQACYGIALPYPNITNHNRLNLKSKWLLHLPYALTFNTSLPPQTVLMYYP